MRKHLVGIRPWKGKRQAYLEAQGKSYAKSFDLGTPDSVLIAWQETTRLRYGGRTVQSGSFEADVAEYLSRITALVTYQQKAAHLELWLQALGRTRSRVSITATDLDRVMQGWLTTRTVPDYAAGQRGRPSRPEGLSAGTIRKRRGTLRAMFSKLDGKQAVNVVRASEAPKEPKAELRGTDYETIARILGFMPESKSKRRVEVLAYTGLPPQILKTVERPHFREALGSLRVVPRRKGKGVEARTLPLTVRGLEALRRFDQQNAYGGFVTEKCNIAFQRACVKADVTGLTLYDLRHSFGAQMYRVTRDLATVARFLLLASTKMAERYAQAANQEVDAAAAAQFLPAEGRNLSPKPVPRRKSPKRKHLRRAS
jgi:integrase